MNVYQQRYLEIRSLLDEALGPEEAEGSGQGIVQDVALIVRQRNEALSMLETVFPHAAEKIRAIRHIGE